MVIAHHLVWTVYGTWLPNDPRGSGSHYVQSDELETLGEIHYGRKQVQPAAAIVRDFYQRAESKLNFPIIRFEAAQIQVVGAALGEAIAEFGYTYYACAILPDHAHFVIRKHRDNAERMIENLQQSSRLRISKELQIPSAHPIWTQGGWRGFLVAERVRTVIRYIQRNPVRAGIAEQNWDFVQQYDGWPFANKASQMSRVHPLAV